MGEHERPVVAYLGPEASYTHQAALSTFPNKETTTLSPRTTIADVFSAVQNRSAHRGVVPFENSSNGSVVFTLDLIANLHGMHPDVLVCGEAYVAVKHCLLGHAAGIPSTQKEGEVRIDPQFTNPLAIPKSDLSRVKKLYSHPQAWGQCKAFLATYLKGVPRHDVDSTSRAAEIVAADKTGESAALSSLAAADVFGLDVLAESINDRKGNTTRFLVIRHASSPPLPSPSLSLPTPNPPTPWKSLITFTLNHTAPGSLAQCLSAFSSHGLSLTSINTRPSGVENWHYVFFVECGGRKEDGEGEGDVNRALGELGGVARTWRWLGSWESRL
ncbi:PDT-domain-containing protein [Ophiobolus disseminans]|uniref:prephenate dehydratase n=1 Tax=Ophiobolus disseminans TaxID=1469910 RepID=A0A6A6ZS67_9PLEO|nr:PDT-domain-containing protein [Ophiobolus disseminans]